MAACDSCGAALTPGAATCDLCGTPVGRPDATPVEGGMPACPNCGHHPPVGSTFCNACGEPLPATLGHASDGARPPVAVPVRPDPASNAVGTRAMVVIGVGLLVVLIRLWGGLPEGVMYAILLMNSVTPLINRVTQPRRFGG